jgi:hypothetical protein
LSVTFDHSGEGAALVLAISSIVFSQSEHGAASRGHPATWSRGQHAMSTHMFAAISSVGWWKQRNSLRSLVYALAPRWTLSARSSIQASTAVAENSFVNSSRNLSCMRTVNKEREEREGEEEEV